MKLSPFADSDPVYRADCPSRVILDQIADKWSMMVLAVLAEPRRFNAIKRRLNGVTQRVLTQTLRKLERNGMVSRTVGTGRVLSVEYSRPPLGHSLQEPFSVLFDWTIANMPTILEHQRRYDEQ
ncbi:winged helix-turn-helix transcriptional regulator [Paucibacter sp. M5-1]|uniref:winged helix-turn-helix transcriptional regulator n=1 Tax=Paucibacter sp. M5-1 TaxID=3015998 RepID=UPI0022B8B9CF|nr:helix-turn-helix domain-containing protein [Paucibacter sp. M5-1]MCZ7880498.1 helix-turn-helix domain-containing protein [Paucibacter sp. M5-1]